MIKNDIVSGKTQPLDALEKIVHALMAGWTYVPGPKTMGAGEADRSREHWTTQYTDSRGREVLFFEYQNLNGNGAYTGILRTALPPSRHEEFYKTIAPILKKISPSYAKQPA